MAKNKGETRKGAVKDRTQVYNSKTDMYIKRGPNGQFMSSKKGTPYKGVTKEKVKQKKK